MMNPGVSEEAGQTARSFIDVFRGNAAMLALIAANVAMMVFTFYALLRAGEMRDNNFKEQMAYQRHVDELLSRCVVPAPTP